MTPEKTDRFIGLNEWALEKVTLPGAKTSLTRSIYADTQGDKHPLFRYELPDGTICEEDLYTYQSLDADRKIYFLALRDGVGNWITESLWSDKDIQEACEISLELLKEESMEVEEAIEVAVIEG
ncbi:MAG: hypothetical protein AAB646_01140 [Patescibacteria group bacterium]